MSHSLFRKDLYRYYGEQGESVLRRLFRPLELRYLQAFRGAQSSSFFLKKAYYILKVRHLSQRTQIQIPVATNIGEGFYIGHLGRVIVHPNAVIGKNCNIATGVTVGQENRGARKGTPTIGDRCWIGTNAVVVGNIRIGNDVMIAPLSFVNFDVPDHSIVIGNPAKIIHREDATQAYIENLVP